MRIGNFVSEMKTLLVDRPDVPEITTRKIGWSTRMCIGKGIAGQNLKLGDRVFPTGWGDHANSRHLVHVPGEAASFEAYVGLFHE